MSFCSLLFRCSVLKINHEHFGPLLHPDDKSRDNMNDKARPTWGVDVDLLTTGFTGKYTSDVQDKHILLEDYCGNIPPY